MTHCGAVSEFVCVYRKASPLLEFMHSVVEHLDPYLKYFASFDYLSLEFDLGNLCQFPYSAICSSFMYICL